jgi:Tol biopolymer transport system component
MKQSPPILTLAARIGVAVIGTIAILIFAVMALGGLTRSDRVVALAQHFDGMFPWSATIELVDVNRRLVGQLVRSAADVNYFPSPDQRYLAYAIQEGDSQRCQVRELTGFPPVIFTSAPAETCTPVWSGDSRRLVAVGDTGNTWTLTIFDVERREAQTYTHHHSARFWVAQVSPDGQQIAFLSEYSARWTLSLLDLNSGNLTFVADAPDALEGNILGDWRCYWSPDGRWFALPSPCTNYDFIWWFDSHTLTTHQISDSPPEIYYQHIGWSPDGSRLIVGAAPSSIIQARPGYRLLMLTPATGQLTPLLPFERSRWNAGWLPSGRYVTLAGNIDDTHYDLYLFDTASGDWTTLDENSATFVWHGWSPDERFLVFAGEHGGMTTYQLLTIETGEIRQLLQTSDYPQGLGWSPDGAFLYIAAGQFSGSGVIHVLDMQTGVLSQVSTALERISARQWAPDSRRLVFTASDQDSDFNYIVNLADLSVTPLANHPGLEYQPVWAADGQRYVFMGDEGGNRNLYLADLNHAETDQITATSGHEFAPLWVR